MIKDMNNMASVKARTAAAVLTTFALMAGGSSAWAGIDDYEFQLVSSEVKLDASAVVAVRLVDKRTGKPVPDAVIFEQRIDMAPEGMEPMNAPIELQPSTEPGIYNFKAGPTMKGTWRLSLSAKVQGEPDTLKESLEFKVLP